MPPTASAPPTVASPWAVPAALTGLLLALVGFLCWQYLMPPGFRSSFVLNHAGVEHFRDGLGVPRVDVVALAPYTAGFRAWLGALWVSYFVVLLAGMLGAPLPRRHALVATVVAVALGVALVWPPSFSSDVYGYVAYGRLQVLFGLNPYTTTQRALVDLHDPTGRFLAWGIGSPYGPLWTSVSIAVVWVLRGASLLAQVLAMKVLGGAALVATAFAGRRLAERLAPGRGDLTLLAIGLNPLFVIEGPGNAHNDLAMMALVVAALGATQDGRARRAALWAGVAGAVKFLPLLLVPWIVLADWRERPRPVKQALRDALVAGLAALAPIVLAFVPYWAGPRTLLGLQRRWSMGHASTGAADASALAQGVALALVYALATVLVLRGARERSHVRIHTAWMLVTAFVYLVAAGIWLPWYASWIWVVALLRWDRRTALVSYLCLCFAVVLTLRYSVP